MSRTISKMTTRDLVVVHWMDGVDRAYSILLSNKVRHLPVVDDAGEVIGIISDRDFQRAMQIDQPDFFSGRVSQPEFDPNSRVRDFMSWPVETIDEEEPVAAAVRIMLTKKISSLLVVRGEKVVGIVTTEDMLRLLLSEPEGMLAELKDEVRSIFQNSTIGQVVQSFANAGI